MKVWAVVAGWVRWLRYDCPRCIATKCQCPCRTCSRTELPPAADKPDIRDIYSEGLRVGMALERERSLKLVNELVAALKYLLELGGDDDRRIVAEAAIAKAEGR